MRINSFNHFRAIAILLIMAGHSYGIVGMEFHTLFDVTVKNLITGATSLFVFISGFLFYYVFYPRYEYKKFLIKKFRNVLSPYLILGFIPVFLYVYTRQNRFDGYFLPGGTGIISEYLVPGLKYYLSGAFIVSYWYIPFIIITFALSPAHAKYIRCSLSVQLSFIFLFSVLSIFIHRPVANINVLHSVIYFTPVYLIGITTAIYRDEVYKYLKGKDALLLFGVISLAVLQAWLGQEGNSHKPFFEYGGVDITYFQKVVMCFFFMIWLNRFEGYNNRYAHVVAATSFAAFFIHPFILWFLGKVGFSFSGLGSWPFLFVFVSVLSLFCVLIAKSVRAVFPRYSRYIIGY